MALGGTVTYTAPPIEEVVVIDRTLEAIVYCESRGNPNAVNYNYDEDGVIWSEDRGLAQINNYFHQEIMMKLGLDYYDPIDNWQYTKILFKEQGTKPWKASQFCWEKKLIEWSSPEKDN